MSEMLRKLADRLMRLNAKVFNETISADDTCTELYIVEEALRELAAPVSDELPYDLSVGRKGARGLVARGVGKRKAILR